MNVTTIKTFKEIKFPINSLILCDIDDTLVNYSEETNEYWKNNMYLEDPKYEKWADLIRDVPPTFSCNTFEDFYIEIKQTGSELVFITARNPSHMDMTENQLKQLGLSEHSIHYLAGKLKGEFIKETFKTGRHTIFIDDSYKQVNDVLEKNPYINVYHLNIRNQMSI